MHDDFGGLKRDLPLLIARRKALTLFGAAAGSLLIGGSALRGQAHAAGTCIADAPETAGPYPADGTNHAGGETSDVLTQTGVVRRDIRYSFLSTSTRAKGVPVRLKLKLVNSRNACALLAGYAVYAWQCDRDAKYSLYTIPGESYLRGVQVSDEKGHLVFKTIFPACYPGRYPHIHLEIFSSLAQATTGRNAVLTTQLALPHDACQDVYDNAHGYQSSIGPFKNISLSSDTVFGDDTPAQLAAMTPKMKGSVADGYSAVATVGVAV